MSVAACLNRHVQDEQGSARGYAKALVKLLCVNVRGSRQPPQAHSRRHAEHAKVGRQHDRMSVTSPIHSNAPLFVSTCPVGCGLGGVRVRR